MSLIPTPTNDNYRGQIWACVALALVGLYALIGGLVQVLLPDSGLISFAGLNLAHEGGLQMIAFAAWLGATRFIWGLTLLLVALLYRDFTALFLLLAALEKALIILGSLIKPVNNAAATDTMLPDTNIAFVLLIVCLLALLGARAKSS